MLKEVELQNKIFVQVIKEIAWELSRKITNPELKWHGIKSKSEYKKRGIVDGDQIICN